MASHKSSAKGPYEKTPRRSHCECPVCGKKFSLNTADHRKYVVAGKRPCCSRSCAGARRSMQADLQKLPDESRERIPA